MLMKAAQPCKQHGRMSLEYITIHNCLPRAGGVHMAQPWSPTPQHTQASKHTHTHTHTHTALSAHLDTPQAGAAKRRQVLRWRWRDIQLGCLSKTFWNIKKSAPEHWKLIFQIHNTLYLSAFQRNFLFFLLLQNTAHTCLERLKIDTKCWELRRQTEALSQNVGALRETRGNEGVIKWASESERERELRQECDCFQVSELQCARERERQKQRDRERKGGGEQVNQATVCGRVIRCLFLFSQRQSKHNAELYLPGLWGFRVIVSQLVWFDSISRTLATAQLDAFLTCHI